MAINKVIISGNLTRDAELRQTSEGTPVLNFCVAMNEKRYDRETGQTVDLPPVYVDCAIWGRRATNLAQYLTKGLKCIVEGHLHYSTWMKDGEKRHALSVTVDKFEFAGGKSDDVSANPASTTATQTTSLDREVADMRNTAAQMPQDYSGSYDELYAAEDISF